MLLETGIRPCSKAALCGAKLTERVWTEIVRGNYVTQRFAPPGERMVTIDSVPVSRKIRIHRWVRQCRSHRYRHQPCMLEVPAKAPDAPSFTTTGSLESCLHLPSAAPNDQSSWSTTIR